MTTTDARPGDSDQQRAAEVLGRYWERDVPPWAVAEVVALVDAARAEEREAVLRQLVRHGLGETDLYDEIGHGAHRWERQ